MGLKNGLFRKACGAEIIPCTIDYNDIQLGGVKIPISITAVQETKRDFARYKYYEALLSDQDALGVFNVNNYCMCVVTRKRAYEYDVHRTGKLDLVQWDFIRPLPYPHYSHIGYVKTYHKCIAVSQFPTYLLQEVGSSYADGYSQKLDGEPLLNPPLALYKQLIDTDADAVYFDQLSHSAKFLYK